MRYTRTVTNGLTSERQEIEQFPYSNGSGQVLMVDDGEDAPAGFTRIDEIPESVDWPSLIAARRYDAEISGIDVGGIRVETDDRSKLLINGAAVEAMLDPEYRMQWKTPAGFVELSAAQVLGVARAVRAHVQACFDREANLLALGDAVTIDDLATGWPEI